MKFGRRHLVPVAVVVAALLDTTLSPRISPVGGRPLFLLSVVVYFAWMRGALAGTLFGFGIGLLADLLSLNPPGLSMIGMTLVGAVVGNIWGSIYKDRFLVQLLVLGGAAWLHETVLFLVGTGLEFGDYPAWFLRRIAPTMILTAFTVPLLLLAWQRLTGHEISFDAERLVVRR